MPGLVTALVITVPTMVVAEDWRGRPLIDYPGAWWLVPAVIAVVAFFVGGMVAARGRRTAGRGLAAGLVVGVTAVVVLLAGDGVRRLLVNPTLPAGVVDYWLEAAAVAVVVTVLGALAAVLAATRRPPGRDDPAGRARAPRDANAPRS